MNSSPPLRPANGLHDRPNVGSQSRAGAKGKEKSNDKASCLLLLARLFAVKVVLELGGTLPTATAPCLVDGVLVFHSQNIVAKLGQYNKANAADCQSTAFLVSDVACHGDSSFDNMCWQTADSRRDVLCRVESYGKGFASSALIGSR